MITSMQSHCPSSNLGSLPCPNLKTTTQIFTRHPNRTSAEVLYFLILPFAEVLSRDQASPYYLGLNLGPGLQLSQLYPSLIAGLSFHTTLSQNFCWAAQEQCKFHYWTCSRAKWRSSEKLQRCATMRETLGWTLHMLTSVSPKKHDVWYLNQHLWHSWEPVPKLFGNLE